MARDHSNGAGGESNDAGYFLAWVPRLLLGGEMSNCCHISCAHRRILPTSLVGLDMLSDWALARVAEAGNEPRAEVRRLI